MINKYLKIAKIYGEEGKCSRRKVGAVIVKDDMIIGAGYNGNKDNPCNIMNPCNRVKVESGVSLGDCNGKYYHAEAVAIEMANRLRYDTKGAIIIVTDKPCLDCTVRIANAGIGVVYYENEYTLSPEDEKKRDVVKYNNKLLFIKIDNLNKIFES